VPEIRYVKIENLETHPEKKLNVGDLAEYWGVGESTVYRLAYNGAIPFTRIGRRVKIDADGARQFEREAGRPDDERADGQGRPR
jgi:excisionase family DNA binding protein